MKIRILDDSVRLRLDRTEVDQVAAGTAVEAVTRFPNGAVFRYRLVAGGGFAATFRDGRIDVVVPASAARHWAATDTEVAMHGRLALADGELTVLVEKDFECLAPRAGESQANRFPNPQA